MNNYILLGTAVAGVLIFIWHKLKDGNMYSQSYGWSEYPYDETYEYEPKVSKNHPKPPSGGDKCVICLENLVVNTDQKYGIVALPCSHWFHLDCIHRVPEYLGPKCPVCKRPFDPKALRSAPCKIQQPK